MKTIYLVRHCKASGQETEAPLTEEGRQQALELASFFSGIEINKIVSSPYLRALQTIEPLAVRLGLEIQQDTRLGERVLSSGYLSNWLELLKATFEDPDLVLEGGESSREAMLRAKAVVNELLEASGDGIILVSHGNLTALLLKAFDDGFGFTDWEAMTNPDVYKITIDEEQADIRRVWK